MLEIKEEEAILLPVPMFPWKDSYSVGIEIIDAQHQRLLQILNRLYDANSKQRGIGFLTEILKEFQRCTVEHFDTEEKLMEHHHYPDLIPHRVEHDKCKDKIVQYLRILGRGDPVSTVEVCRFLVEWIEQHLADSDMAYVEFFKLKGVK